MEGTGVFRTLVRGVAVAVLLLAGCGGGGGGGGGDGKGGNDGGEVNGYNVNLSSLEVSSGTLTPSFDQTVTAYTVTVDTAVTSITLKPASVDDKAVITVNGSSVDSDSDSQDISLTPGVPETISITITAPDKTTIKTYTVEALRQGTAPPANVNLSSLSLSTGTLSPSFDQTTVSYTATVGYGVSSVTVNADAADAKASVKINGSTNKTVALAVGVNAITVTVTGYDGKTVKDYTISITRGAPSANANLSDLEISKGALSPGFGASIYSYNASVIWSVASLSVTPTADDSGSRITVNGTTVNSGSSISINLLENSTTAITVEVTAQDGTTKNSYVINMTRAAKSPNANLSSLVISNGMLTPRFDPNTTFYRAEIATDETASTITPTVSFEAAIVSVNGTAVNSGSASPSIPLNIGINKASVRVIAEDGTEKTYSLELVRVPDKSKNAFLAGLYLSSGSISPVFCKTKTAYTAEVASNISSITVTPSIAGVNGTAKVNGTVVATNTASAPITLASGANTITVEVWAEDASSYMKYVVTVTRLASGVTSSNANGAGLTADGGTLTPAFDPSVTGYTLYTNEPTYTVTLATAGAGSSVTVNGTAVTSGTTSVTISSTTNATIVVTAADGTIKTYTVTVVKDITPPTAGTLSATKCEMNYINIAWTPASDDMSASSDLNYAIYRSASNNISTIADAAANGTLVKNYTKNIGDCSVQGLSADTGWYFALIVKDGAGNKTIYPVLSARTMKVLSMAHVVPNGSVMSIAVKGTTIYIGGAFTALGYRTSRNAIFSTETGKLSDITPQADNQTNCTVSDGEGGWYIGGYFTSVYGIKRNHIAHILADGSLDEWNPDIDSVVNVLTVRGNTIYAGGIFTKVGADTRNRLAAIDASTGKATSWNPNVNGLSYSEVRAFAIDGSLMYAGGTFTKIGTISRNYLAAIDVTTGNATNWNPNMDSTVNTVVIDGTTVYAGGYFNTVGTDTRGHLAAIDKSTGKATSWNPGAISSYVNVIAVNGTTIYAGGDFDYIGTDARNGLAAIDKLTGKVTSWNPEIGDDMGSKCEVNALVMSGTTIYAGGQFTKVGTDQPNSLVALDMATGKATSWSSEVDLLVKSLGVSGKSIYVAGNFFAAGTVKRNRLAAIDTVTGAITDWNPNVDSYVRALFVRGNTLYAGGSFNAVGSAARNRIAAIDMSTGEVTDWDPNISGTVYALAANGSSIYAGGQFYKVGTENRKHLVALDESTGKATDWNPNVNESVSSIIAGESVVYIGGQFTSVGTDTRNYIAAIDASTGKATGWNPNMDDLVHNIQLSGTTIYAGGQFNKVGTDTRNYLAAIDKSTGKATSWNPDLNFSVWSLVVSGNLIYAGGGFSRVGTETRNKLAAIEISSGKATDWNPNADYNVYTIVKSGNTIYAIGSFQNVGGLYYPKFTAIDITTGLPK